jgi:hypothetical protein
MMTVVSVASLKVYSVCDRAEVFGSAREIRKGAPKELMMNDKRNGCIVSSAVVCRWKPLNQRHQGR